MADEQPSIGEYLIDALAERGVRHVFGVPGDYILRLFQIGSERGTTMVNSTREETAAYAADGYAREAGMGAAAVTFGVGILASMAAVGGANAERVPLVLIGGGPGMGERDGRRIHHMPSDDMTVPRRMISEITARAVLLDDPARAFEEIDRTLDLAQRLLRPVFLEIPRDLMDARPEQVWRHPGHGSRPRADEGAVRDAVADVAARLDAAERPVLWSGVGVLRRGLGREVLALAEKVGAPVVESVMGKGSVDETHPLVLGVYAGATTEPHLRRLVEASDCVIEVAVDENDIDLGAFTVEIPRERIVGLAGDHVRVGHRTYAGVRFADVLRALGAAPLRRRELPGDLPYAWHPHEPGDALTTDAVAALLEDFLEPEDVLVCDVGSAAHLVGDVRLARAGQLHIARYYVGMGFAVPAAAGAGLAGGYERPVVLIGDGSFQMTGVDLSTAIAQGLRPIVIVLDNRGYTTERAITDGPFNGVSPWDYARVADVVGGEGTTVATAEELRSALGRAREVDRAWVISVRLDPHDYPRSLRALAEGLEKLMHGPGQDSEGEPR